MEFLNKNIGRGGLAQQCFLAGALLLSVSGTAAIAQDGTGNPPPPPMQSNRPPMERAFRDRGGPGHDGMGRWWDNPQVAKDLNLGADQKQKMDDIFQQGRLKLIDLHASLQREEATLDPLINADTPDETKVLAQIDKVAAARAELEKANARLLLSVRQVLTPEQWTKLKASRAQRMAHGGPGGQPGGDAHGGPGMGPPPN
jgi:periplasmic protein CpxP/Spy